MLCQVSETIHRGQALDAESVHVPCMTETPLAEHNSEQSQCCWMLSFISARALLQGRLQCLGSTSHLKLRFGGGYLLEVQAPDKEALQARLGAFIVRELGGQAHEERHLGHTKYLLPAKHQVECSVFSQSSEVQTAAFTLQHGGLFLSLQRRHGHDGRHTEGRQA